VGRYIASAHQLVPTIPTLIVMKVSFQQKFLCKADVSI
jgi:hypothetical protein